MASDKLILTLQVGGFVAVLVALPFTSGAAQVLFAVAFAVHFTGDLLRAKKDGVI